MPRRLLGRTGWRGSASPGGRVGLAHPDWNQLKLRIGQQALDHHPLNLQLLDVSLLACVLERDRADIALSINLQNRALV